MIRNITLFICFLLGTVFSTHAQLELSANPEYGQIFDIVHDTAQTGTLYARTVGNHIVKSEDNGESWQVLYSDPMQYYCTLSSLRLINNGQNLSFIVKAEGTDYNKVIILNPTDGSIVKTFPAPNPHRSDILIASYDIFENDNDIVLLHTTYDLSYSFTNEVFRTTDGGISWESIYYSPDYSEIAINNVAIAPDNADKLFLMRGMSPGTDFGGLLMSLNGGQTWNEKIPGNTYSPIAFNPTNPQDIFLGTYYGFGDHEQNLYRSLDGGETWNIIPIIWTSMGTDNFNEIAFNPTNPDNIIVLEENEIAISNDNGASWQNQVYTSIDPESYYYGLSVSFNPFIPDEVIIGTDFYPLKSSDGGITLEKLENPFVNSTGRIDSYFSPTENHLYYGLRNGFIHRDLNTGEEAGYRMRSLNNTFGATTFPYSDKEIPGRIFNSSRFGMNSVVEMSLDHGENYVAIYSSMSYLNIYEMATSASNPNIVWFSFGDSIFRIDITNPASPIVGEITIPSFELCYGLVIDPTDEGRIVLSAGSKVYVTTNGGFSWDEITAGLENLNTLDTILKIAINPLNSNEYIMASTRGIYISTDAGLSWNQKFDGFIENIFFSPLTDGNIVAVNHYSDGYLFPESTTRIVYSNDGGETWEIIPGDALEYLISGSSTVHFIDDQAEVYFGTFDMGLVKYTVDLSELGLENSVNPSSLSLFPNPASQFINILNTNGSIKEIAIYSISGQKILQPSKNNSTLDVSGLTSGAYLIKIATDEGVTFKRFIKN